MSRIKIVLGKRGSGKSVRLREELRLEPRVVLYDTLREDTYNSYTRVETYRELCHKLLEDRPVFRLAYSWPGDVEREADFERFCKAVYCCRNLAVGVEEIDQFCSASFMPHSLDLVVSLGRHRQLSLYCASRRPKEIHPLIRSQAVEVISFLQTEPADLEWCRAVMGAGADELPSLEQYEYVHWTDGAGYHRSRVYYDLLKAPARTDQAEPLEAPLDTTDQGTVS